MYKFNTIFLFIQFETRYEKILKNFELCSDFLDEYDKNIVVVVTFMD